MRYLTLCSGIEAPTLAWKPLGWQAVAFAEVDPFCNAVLAHHYPETPNYGDITKITEKQIKELGPIDLVCGGTPCQGFSVAGLRRGLGDERSNLAIRFCELVAIARPAWLLWENVPGCLSTNGWRDFRRFIRAIADIGYSLAWTVLDAQYFGLAQRRKRVFLIGHLGTDWRYSAAVLFDRESLSGHPAPSRKAGQDIAGSLASCTSDGGGLGTDFDCDGGTVACPLMAKDWHGVHSDMGTFVTHALRADGFDASEDGTWRGTPLVIAGIESNNQGAGGNRGFHLADEPVQTLGTLTRPAVALAFDCKQSGEGGDISPTLRSMGYDATHANAGGQVAVAFQTRIARNGRGQAKDICDALTSSEGGSHADSKPHVAGAFVVRRLTPKECARLQGVPDNYLDIIYRGKPACDAPKYKALGNSIAVPCLTWIGKRIELVDQIAKQSTPT